MKRLGYYARHKLTGNLYKFKWGNDDTFYVRQYIQTDDYVEADANEFEVLEIYHTKS